MAVIEVAKSGVGIRSEIDNTAAVAGASLIGKLSAGLESAAILVIGDSTGDETNVQNRWVLKTAQYLAARFPEYTVNFRQWDMTTGAAQSDGFNLGSYSALGSGRSVVVQTGTGTSNAGGPFVLDVYNGSASGTTPAYAILAARYATIAPTAVAFDMVITNHGHNMGGAGAEQSRYLITQLTQAVRITYPFASIVITAQNPATPTAADYANDIIRARYMQLAAALGGFGCINVFQTFLNNPNYATDWTSADGLGVHPNADGSEVWFQCVKAMFSSVLPLSFPTPRMVLQDHVYVPASQFDLYVGSPVKSLINGECQMWGLPNGAQSGVSAEVLLPAYWVKFDMWICWAVASTSGFTGSTVVAWNFLRQQRASSINVPSSPGPLPISAWSTVGIQTKNPNNGSAYQTVMSQLTTQGTPYNAPMGIRIQRETAGDNIAETAYLKGVLFKRAM